MECIHTRSYLFYPGHALEIKKNPKTEKLVQYSIFSLSQAGYPEVAISKTPLFEQLGRDLPSPGTPWSDPPAAGPKPEYQRATGSIQSSKLHTYGSSSLGSNLNPTHRLEFRGQGYVIL